MYSIYHVLGQLGLGLKGNVVVIIFCLSHTSDIVGKTSFFSFFVASEEVAFFYRHIFYAVKDI